MYEALITDLDGTAVPISSDGSGVDNQTRQAVSSAIAAGRLLSCATGRPWEIAKPVITSLGFVSPCIVEGGTRIVEVATGKSLWEKDLDAEVADWVLGLYKRAGTTGMLMSSANPVEHDLASVSRLPDNIRFLFLIAVDAPSAEKILTEVNEHPHEAIAHITPSWSGNGLVDIHVTHPEATKEHAIRIWQELEGVSMEATIGVGDSGNDQPIFLASGLKVAVGNATPELKAQADYIAPNVEDHALEHVIRKFLL